jgi:NAD-reducing hydrogenase large subunit
MVAKACDALLAVEIPPTAAKLRRLMNLAQLVQSHALSFFHLSSPDLLFGMDSDPGKRNILGVVEAHPTLAKDGIALRKFGQEIIAMLGGKRIQCSSLFIQNIQKSVFWSSVTEIHSGAMTL